MIGQNLRASEIPLAGSRSWSALADQVIAHCVAMKAEEVAPAAEAGAEAAATPAEPEVIKKGKKEEDAAAAEAGEGQEKGHRTLGMAGAFEQLVVGLGNPGEEYEYTPTIWDFWWWTGWPSGIRSRSLARIREPWWDRERWRVSR